VLADRQANISYVDIIPHVDRDAEIYLEFAVDDAIEPIVGALRTVPGVSSAEATPSFSKIYGKRIVIMGGGAQVGQVALGAITEADRHNIRGERISVDTIPLVGEEALASAVRSVVRLPRVRLLVLAGSIMGGGAQVGQVALGAITEADRHNIRGERISVDTIPLVGEDALAGAVRSVVRLPRVRLLVLAGSIMGGDITRAVEEVRTKGLIVISLNMAGSVPDVADLVVSDPVQAGVMAVMAIADTAKFDIIRQQKRKY
jgi:energy-converting hydrogenase B subunit Q